MTRPVMNIVMGLVLLALLLAPARSSLQQAEEEVVRNLFGPKSTYNKQVRPPGQRNASVSAIGEPVMVSVNVYIRSISEIDENSGEYRVSMTLRQSWNDNRLRYNPSNAAIQHIVITDPGLIWTPDLFFPNEIEASVHDVTQNNVLIRVKPSGDVLYSARISGRFSCSMDLSDYPHGIQVCDFKLASYAYTTSEIAMMWRSHDPLQVAKFMDLGSSRLRALRTDVCNSRTITGDYSCLRVDLMWTRENRLLLQAYLPLGLLVIVSWLIFWLDEREVKLRVLVIVISLVASALLASQISSEAPDTMQTMAIESWIFWCLVFVVLAMVEQVLLLILSVTSMRSKDVINQAAINTLPLVDTSGEGDKTESSPGRQGLSRWLSRCSVSRRVDMASRVIFPVTFLIFNVVYWMSHLSSARNFMASLPVSDKMIPYMHQPFN